jgi:two-component system cell cycle sensor histidine kinase/response regulator CckA
MLVLTVMRVSLVVDDEPSVRRYVSAILQQEGFRTMEAGDGAHALQIVQELSGGVDLIVSDIQMPNGDGLSLAQAVKHSFPAVPVILVSGNTQPDADFEFVKKPFLPATLAGVVRKLFPHKVSSGRPVPPDPAWSLSRQVK